MLSHKSSPLPWWLCDGRSPFLPRDRLLAFSVSFRYAYSFHRDVTSDLSRVSNLNQRVIATSCPVSQKEGKITTEMKQNRLYDEIYLHCIRYDEYKVTRRILSLQFLLIYNMVTGIITYTYTPVLHISLS